MQVPWVPCAPEVFQLMLIRLGLPVGLLFQVETAGDSLSCAAMSPSGEALVFGGSGGYTHLWSSSSSPRIVGHNRTVVHLKHPTTQVRLNKLNRYKVLATPWLLCHVLGSFGLRFVAPWFFRLFCSAALYH